MKERYRDRRAAGEALATALDHYRGRDNLLILALPRGGVPVAAPVAEHLGAALDLLLVRKLGVPRHEELAMGAIASGGVMVLNEDVIQSRRIGEATLEAVLAREREELGRRDRHYRGDRPEPDPAGRVVIVVDDGLATGATMRAAVSALRQRRPARVVVAVPVASREAEAVLLREADEVVCPLVPAPFFGVGDWYRNFIQTGDEEVRALLARYWEDR